MISPGGGSYSVSRCVRPWVTLILEHPFKLFMPFSDQVMHYQTFKANSKPHRHFGSALDRSRQPQQGDSDYTLLLYWFKMRRCCHQSQLLNILPENRDTSLTEHLRREDITVLPAMSDWQLISGDCTEETTQRECSAPKMSQENNINRKIFWPVFPYKSSCVSVCLLSSSGFRLWTLRQEISSFPPPERRDHVGKLKLY